MGELRLDDEDRAMLRGARGDAARLAMRIIVDMARSQGASRLIGVTGAHVDGCLYHGESGIDFAERLSVAGARVKVPTTLNVGALDLLHPDRYRGDPDTARGARRLMDLYVGMGCRPTWTCAPYQLSHRPGFGEHVAWAESNAIVFANSVLGARTDRYGDFIDICAAITGRVPDAGLHRDENRRGTLLLRLNAIPERLLQEDSLYPVLGHLAGAVSGAGVPVIEGLPPDTDEDRLKALGAAAASSGSVGMFHAVGVTPEAGTLHAALNGRQPDRVVEITSDRLRRARDELSTSDGKGTLGAVSVGTPHFSLREFELLITHLGGASVHPDVELFVSTGRDVLAAVEARGWTDALRAAGVTLVTDTCTYVTPIIGKRRGPVMTNSAKWAYYAPANIGVDVLFGSLRECVRSAVEGRVWRDDAVWTRP
jgi:predicted aconitase